MFSNLKLEKECEGTYLACVLVHICVVRMYIWTGTQANTNPAGRFTTPRYFDKTTESKVVKFYAMDGRRRVVLEIMRMRQI